MPETENDQFQIENVRSVLWALKAYKVVQNLLSFYIYTLFTHY